MSQLKATYSAMFFAAASVAAGVLHYLFQVWSATQLDIIEFGVLNSWIAYFSIALSLGSFAQYAANFFLISADRMRQISWIFLILAVASLWVPFASWPNGAFSSGITGVYLGVVFSWLIGQAQGRLAFTVMGIALLLNGVSKFVFAGVTFPVEHPGYELAWAVSLSYVPAIVFISCTMILFAPKWPRHKSVETSSDIMGSLKNAAILSFATVFIPQIDIVAIHRSQSAEVIGEFARISLLYKAVFFAFLIFAQWLLPQQIQRSTSPFRFVRWLSSGPWPMMLFGQALGIIAVIAALTIGAFVMPQIAHQWDWIVLSCLNMVMLTNLFFVIQSEAVLGRWQRPTAILTVLILELGFAMLMKPTVTTYLVTVTTCNFALWLVLSTWSVRAKNRN